MEMIGISRFPDVKPVKRPDKTFLQMFCRFYLKIQVLKALGTSFTSFKSLKIAFWVIIQLSIFYSSCLDRKHEENQLGILEIPLISIQNLFLRKLIFHQLQKVSEANIWFSHFKLNVLEGDSVSFTGACPFRPWRGGKVLDHPVLGVDLANIGSIFVDLADDLDLTFKIVTSCDLAPPSKAPLYETGQVP